MVGIQLKYFSIGKGLFLVDGPTPQERLDWENTTEDIKNNTEYWSDQALLFDQMLQYLETKKPSMSHEEYISKKAEFE